MRMFLILAMGITISSFSQFHKCEARFYFEVFEYGKNPPNKSFLPIVTTNRLINDTLCLRIFTNAVFTIEKKNVTFKIPENNKLKQDTIIFKNSNEYIIKNGHEFLIFSNDSFFRNYRFHYTDSLKDNKNKAIGLINIYYIPLYDTLIDNKKLYAYQKGYQKIYFSNIDQLKNYYDSGFIKTNVIFYLPGLGEVFIFNEENYQKYNEIGNTKKYYSILRKKFPNSFNN